MARQESLRAGERLYVTTVLIKQLFDDLGPDKTPKDVRNAAC
ncbi:MAG: hypothetical protein ACLPKB_05920 [Xanthobacteraceae bacterium]